MQSFVSTLLHPRVRQRRGGAGLCQGADAAGRGHRPLFTAELAGVRAGGVAGWVGCEMSRTSYPPLPPPPPPPAPAVPDGSKGVDGVNKASTSKAMSHVRSISIVSHRVMTGPVRTTMMTSVRYTGGVGRRRSSCQPMCCMSACVIPPCPVESRSDAPFRLGWAPSLGGSCSLLQFQPHPYQAALPMQSTPCCAGLSCLSETYPPPPALGSRVIIDQEPACPRQGDVDIFQPYPKADRARQVDVALSLDGCKGATLGPWEEGSGEGSVADDMGGEQRGGE